MGLVLSKNVVAIAINEIGYHEKATNDMLDDKLANSGHNNYTKYARDLWNADPHFFQGCKNGYEWCASFVAWCIYQASGRDSTYSQQVLCYTGPYGAGCGAAVAYYKQAKRFSLPTADFIPSPGDQIFFGGSNGPSHTGIVEKVTGGVAYTIEGNSNDEVRRCSYLMSNPKIVGYGHPIYDDDDFPFVDVKPSDWFYDATKWAYENNITTGTDPTHFSPHNTCTRAEVVQMLYQSQKK